MRNDLVEILGECHCCDIEESVWGPGLPQSDMIAKLQPDVEILLIITAEQYMNGDNYWNQP